MHGDAALWEASRHAANPPATGSTAFQLHCHFWLRTMWPDLMLTKTAASLHCIQTHTDAGHDGVPGFKLRSWWLLGLQRLSKHQHFSDDF